MPTLDLTDAFAPEFLDEFIVVRRVETVDQHGRAVLNETHHSASGVIGPTSPDDLQRLPEGDYMNKAITIQTLFRVQGPSTGNRKADEIIWHGSRYLVRALDDYSGYGAGFVQAVAVSVDMMDPGPVAGTAW